MINIDSLLLKSVWESLTISNILKLYTGLQKLTRRKDDLMSEFLQANKLQEDITVYFKSNNLHKILLELLIPF